MRAGWPWLILFVYGDAVFAFRWVSSPLPGPVQKDSRIGNVLTFGLQHTLVIALSRCYSQSIFVIIVFLSAEQHRHSQSPPHCVVRKAVVERKQNVVPCTVYIPPETDTSEFFLGTNVYKEDFVCVCIYNRLLDNFHEVLSPSPCKVILSGAAQSQGAVEESSGSRQR